MSRALYIDATNADVRAACGKHKASFSVIEPLQSGGTRIVLHNAHDAAVLAKAYKNKILTGEVTRIPIRMR